MYEIKKIKEIIYCLKNIYKIKSKELNNKNRKTKSKYESSIIYKKLKNTNKYNNKLSYNLFGIFYFIILFQFLGLSIAQNDSFTEIEITIKGNGTQMVLNKDFIPIPDFVAINYAEEGQIPINNYVVNLSLNENTIR